MLQPLTEDGRHSTRGGSCRPGPMGREGVHPMASQTAGCGFVAGARSKAEKKNPGRVVEFAYLAKALAVAQRAAILPAA